MKGESLLPGASPAAAPLLRHVTVTHQYNHWAEMGSYATADVSADALWRQLLSSGGEGLHSGKGSLEGQQWVHIDQNGNSTSLNIDRHHLVHSLKLRYRDLAAIDPTLPISSPTVILVRGRAIALNLDVGAAIRMIIAENQVFVLSLPKADDPAVTAIPSESHPLVRQLCRTLRPPKPSKERLPHHEHRQEKGEDSEEKKEGEVRSLPGCHHNGGIHNGVLECDVDYDMPYELRALEIALSAAVGLLSAEVGALEEWGYPAVESLLQGVSRQGLDTVRKVKNAIDKLQEKTQRLVKELADLMEDDDDMADLYLGRRAMAAGLLPLAQPWERDPFGDELSEESSLEEEEEENMKLFRERERRRHNHRDSVDHKGGGGGASSEAGAAAAAAAGSGGSARRRRRRRREQRPMSETSSFRHTQRIRRSAVGGFVDELSSEENFSVDSEEADDVLERAEEEAMQRQESMTLSMAGVAGGGFRVDPHEIEEAEDLLENFFERSDLLVRRLALLDEQVDDTEDLLELDLDQKRNQLVGLNLLVSTVSMSFGFAAAIGGIFGMNLKNSELASDGWVLALVLSLMLAGSAILILVVFIYVWRKRLMFIPSQL